MKIEYYVVCWTGQSGDHFHQFPTLEKAKEYLEKILERDTYILSPFITLKLDKYE